MKHQTARKVYDDNDIANKMLYLWDRWLDEREYEPFTDYADALCKAVESVSGVKAIKATQRPFGVKFTADSCAYHLSISTKGYSMKTVAQ